MKVRCSRGKAASGNCKKELHYYRKFTRSDGSKVRRYIVDSSPNCKYPASFYRKGTLQHGCLVKNRIGKK